MTVWRWVIFPVSVTIFFLLSDKGYGQEMEMTTKTKSASITHDVFRDLPLSQITPQGWLYAFLKNQKDGLTGNVEVAGYPYNTAGWAASRIVRPGVQKGKDWWPYEQVGYYIDGLIRCAYLLKDEQMLTKARQQLQYVLDNQQNDGLLGPTHLAGRWHNWPHAGFFRAYMAEYGVTGNRSIVEKLEKHYLSLTPESVSDELELANLEEICWLYGISGNQQLLVMAEKAYALFSNDVKYRTRAKRTLDFNSDEKPDYHGVVYLELVKIPAILFMYTGKEAYLATARKGLEKLERSHQLISGVPSSTEETKGISPLSGHETCNVAVYPWTMGYMLKITGEVSWADKLERAVFNAGIGSVAKDFTSHQYFSCPNQVIATVNSNHLGYNPARMAYLPGHDVECCTGNINRMMPVYVGLMWLSARHGGLTAALYGPGKVSITAGKEKKEVTVTEETGYPFSEKILFTFETKEPVSFPFNIRIPGWCKDATISINGKRWPGKIAPGTFVTIDRTFYSNDKIEFFLPMRLEISRWTENGAGVERGPLVYSLPIQSNREIIRDYPKSSADMPALNLEPSGTWNYALVATEAGLKKMKVIQNIITENPWNLREVPLRIQVPARRIMNWKMPVLTDSLSGKKLYQNPAFLKDYLSHLEKDTEMIELVPYGATMLRLTVFPEIRDKQIK